MLKRLSSSLRRRRHPQVAVGVPRTLLASAAYLFLISSYYFVKPIRRPLILEQVGFESLHLYFVATPVVTLGAVLLYKKAVAHWQRHLLLRTLAGISFGSLLVFGVCYRNLFSPEQDVPQLVRQISATAFYFFANVYVLLLVSFLWSVLDETHSSGAAERCYPWIVLGAQIGVVMSSGASDALVAAEHLPWLMILSALSLVCYWLLLEVLLVGGSGDLPLDPRPVGTSSMRELLALTRRPYLLGLVLLTFFSTMGDSFFDYHFIGYLDRTIEETENQVRILSRVNLLSGVLNLLLCTVGLRFMVRKFGPGHSLCVYPLALLVGYAALAAGAPLPVIGVLAALLTSLLHAYYEPAKEILYVPTTRLAKYQLKSVNDTFVLKLGSAAGSGSVALYAGFLSSSTSIVVPVVLVVSMMSWSALAAAAERAYRARSNQA